MPSPSTEQPSGEKLLPSSSQLAIFIPLNRLYKDAVFEDAFKVMPHICRPHSSSLMFAPPRWKKGDASNSSWVSGPSLDLVCGVFCQGFLYR